MAILLMGASPVFAAESKQPGESYSLGQAQYGSQIVTAYYVSGNQLCRIIIRVEGSYVTGYTFGRNFYGEYDFTFEKQSIRKTNDAIDGRLAREYTYTAVLHINGASVQIFF